MYNSQFSNGTIVITGGKGFVGKHLQAELARAWPNTKIISWDLPEVDVTQPETYEQQLDELQPDWIVHLAAIASVPAALKDPKLTFEVNTQGTKYLFDALQRHSQDTKVLFISTADIYGITVKEYGGTPISELPLEAAKPVNSYGESKLEAEKIIEAGWNNQTIRVRPFPHIGPGQGLGFVTADFASQIAAIEKTTSSRKSEPLLTPLQRASLRKEEKTIMKVGNLEAKRDFTDVRDVVRAYRLLMEKGMLGEVYHVASGVATSIQSILDTLLSFSSATITVKQDPERLRPSDIPVLVGDAKKLKTVTHWEPSIALQQSLQDILDWWRKQAVS